MPDTANLFDPILQISTIFKTTTSDASIAFKIIRGEIDPIQLPNTFPRTNKWHSICVFSPSATEIKLEALNEILDAAGVEAIESLDQEDTYHNNIVAAFLSTGTNDYHTTIVFDHRTERWLLTSSWKFIQSLYAEQAICLT